MLANNFDWMGRFGYLEFLRDVGKHFPVNVMLQKDSVRSPPGAERHRHELHRVQLHALAGLRFRTPLRGLRLRIAGRRQRPVGQYHGRHRSGPAARRRATLRLHLPAVDQERRREDGQNRVGRLWLSAERTSPYQFYQYWINLDDADVGRCLRFFTDLGQAEIDAVLAEHQRTPAGGRHSGGWPPN